MKRALLLVVVGCSHAHVDTCEDDLGGVWRDGERSWFVIDEGRALEVFPLFPDGDGGAPRVIDLTRSGSVEGTLHRRYERRGDTCEAHLPVHVTKCEHDRLEVIAAEPAPPIGWEPCAWASAPAQVLRWQR